MKEYRDGILTVYTPTFNRAYCLHQLYDSLCTQSLDFSKFEWLVVDDGSQDDTERLISEWIKNSPFKIFYHKQENEGKMAKLNFIHNIIDTELCMCVDSDDYLISSALSDIMIKWKEVKNYPKIAGIVGLDIFKNGDIVGTAFPNDLNKIKFSFFDKFNVKGDKKFVYQTAVINKYPDYPTFPGEKFPAPGYLYRLIDIDYDLAILNKPLCVVEYLEDGISKNKFKQFVKNPNSFMFYRQERMRLAPNYFDRCKNAMHYVSSCIFAKKSAFKRNSYPLTTLLMFPFGLFLNFYIRKTNKKGAV